MTLRILLAACILALAPAAPALAQEAPLTTRYVVSLIGLPVGRANFETRLDGNGYSVSGSLNSAGLANLVSRVAGTSSVSGRLSGDRLFAERYRLAYEAEGKAWSSDVRMRSGRVTGTTVRPERQEQRPDYVPVSQGHLASVVDPLSGLMIKADSNAVCNRTLPLYDGWSRIDLRLSDAGTRAFRAEGFSGEARVCDVRISPVSGYRRGSSGLRYLQGQTMQIWFAPIGETGIFAPVYARVPTQIGPLTLTATTFARG